MTPGTVQAEPGTALRVGFAGTPEFARTALERLHREGFVLPLVLTQPDRPAGRGLKLQASPVKLCAQAIGASVVQPRGLRLDGKFADDARMAQAALLEARLDVIVVAAYGLILPPWLLELPRLGCLNIHASLLPRWRGAAPIQRAIEAGDAHTGIAIMQMDAGLDTGAVLLAQALDIAPRESAGQLQDRLAALGAELIVEALRGVAGATLEPTPQSSEGTTYAHKIEKREAAIDWSLPAAVIERRVRAFDPAPGASFAFGGELVKLWEARLGIDVRATPGTVLAAHGQTLTVACGDGALDLLVLQRPGCKRQTAAQFLQARPLAAGQVLSAAAD